MNTILLRWRRNINCHFGQLKFKPALFSFSRTQQIDVLHWPGRFCGALWSAVGCIPFKRSRRSRARCVTQSFHGWNERARARRSLLIAFALIDFQLIECSGLDFPLYNWFALYYLLRFTYNTVGILFLGEMLPQKHWSYISLAFWCRRLFSWDFEVYFYLKNRLW